MYIVLSRIDPVDLILQRYLSLLASRSIFCRHRQRWQTRDKKVLGLARERQEHRDTNFWNETRSAVQKERNIRKYYTKLQTWRQQDGHMNWSFQKVKIMLIHLFWLNRSDMKGRATGKSISWSSVLSENVSANIALVLTN